MIFSARCSLFTALLCCSIGGVFAQRFDVTNDPQAVATVRQAIAEIGGEAAWANVADIAISGTCQSWDPDDSSIASSSIHWVQSGTEFRYDSTADGVTATFVGGHGNPAHSEGAAGVGWSRDASAAQLPYFAPALVLSQELNSPLFAFHFAEAAPLPGITQSANHVRVVPLLYGQPLFKMIQDWYFDSQTSLPVQVRYGTPVESGTGIQVSTTMQFADYKVDRGIATPRTFSTDYASFISSTCTVASTEINSSPNPSIFDLQLTGGQK